MPQNEKRSNPAPGNVEPQSHSTVSTRKTNNLQNAKKRPRPRRKAANFFNPGAEGVLLRRIAFDREGNVIPSVAKLYDSLILRFDETDVVNLLLAELVTADYGRLGRGLEFEQKYMIPDHWVFDPQGAIPPLTRYITATRRSLEKGLQMLLQLQKDAEAAEAYEAETDVLAADLSCSEEQEDGASENEGEGPPDKIDIRDFLSRDELASSYSDLGDDEVPTEGDARTSEGQPSVSNPPAADKGVAEQFATAAPQAAADAAEHPGETTEGDLPKAA